MDDLIDALDQRLRFGRLAIDRGARLVANGSDLLQRYGPERGHAVVRVDRQHVLKCGNRVMKIAGGTGAQRFLEQRPRQRAHRRQLEQVERLRLAGQRKATHRPAVDSGQPRHHLGARENPGAELLVQRLDAAGGVHHVADRPVLEVLTRTDRA